MRAIEIDEELYSYLQSKGIAFVETPNDTIKRLLNISNAVVEQAKTESMPNFHTKLTNNYIKQAKVNLPVMIREGLVKKGQQLIFQDYRGIQYPDDTVILDDSGLIWQGKQYSMSELASIFLKRLNHKADYVRGPIFWGTENGKTIAELWREYLNKKS